MNRKSIGITAVAVGAGALIWMSTRKKTVILPPIPSQKLEDVEKATKALLAIVDAPATTQKERIDAYVGFAYNMATIPPNASTDAILAALNSDAVKTQQIIGYSLGEINGIGIYISSSEAQRLFYEAGYNHTSYLEELMKANGNRPIPSDVQKALTAKGIDIYTPQNPPMPATFVNGIVSNIPSPTPRTVDPALGLEVAAAGDKLIKEIADMEAAKAKAEATTNEATQLEYNHTQADAILAAQALLDKMNEIAVAGGAVPKTDVQKGDESLKLVYGDPAGKEWGSTGIPYYI